MKYPAKTFASAAFLVTSLALARHTWILDSSRSNARLVQGAGANSELVNSGIARVTGEVKLDTNDLEASFFDLSIYPADEGWEHVLNPEGTWPTTYAPRATDRRLLTFKSTRIVRTGNGALEVTGNLTLTHVERTAATPAEAYAGPVNGDLVIHNRTREITFLFPSASAPHPSTPLIPTMVQKRGVLEIVGSAHVEHEEFSELVGAIKETSWPPVGQNEDCHKLSPLGKNSNGAPSTAPRIALARDNDCQAPISAGEEYSGPQCTPASDNQTAIVLDLTFHHAIPEPSVPRKL
jgi:polyisoprenoid-binding protein YceI